jgi:predicted dehydrogenase
METTMDKVRVGIVGSKFAAGFHMDAYRRNPKVEVVAVAAIDGLEEFKKTWGIKDTYEDYHEMFARDDIDLISGCVPNFLHLDVGIAAARAGKHFIAEKPMALNSADCREMIDVAKQCGTKLFYAEDWVFAPALIRAKQIIDEGGIGEILYVKACEVHNGSHSPFARKKSTCGGGALIHLAIHPIAYMLYLLGGGKNACLAVSAQTSGGLENNYVHKDFEGEDWAASVMTFADGKRAFVEGNYITVGGMDDVVQVYGTAGRLNVRLTFGSCIDVYSQKGYGYAIEKTDFTYGWTKPAVDEFANLGYVDELAYFADCVLKDVQPMYGVNGPFGLKTMQVIEAMYTSAETAQTVTGSW